MSDNTEKVTIIGSGPAGWTAAIYAARANLDPIVYEGQPKRVGAMNDIPGGQLMFTTDVENYPGYPEGVEGPDMMNQFREQAKRFDTRIKTKDIARVDLSVRPFKLWDNDDNEFESHAIIVATGARANWLGLENEQRLAQSGGGISACAICDGALPMFRDKELVVVGGGDSAMEEALYLTKFASKVYIAHRRDELRASKVMQKRAFDNDKIEFLWSTIVVDVLGDEKIRAVKLKDLKSDQEYEKEVGGMFLAIGHTPTVQFLDGQLELDENENIKLADPARSTTSVEGVFAAGDVADSIYRQAVTAAGMGCRAAIDAERWLGAQGLE